MGINKKSKLIALGVATMMVGSSSLHATTNNLIINGKNVSCVVPPVQKNNTTLVPFRVIGENLGAKVEWVEAKKQVVLTNEKNTIRLTLGSKNALINGEDKSLTAAPEMIKGTVMVPVRFVSENLDADVKWDNDTKTVYITSNKNTADTRNEDQESKTELSHQYHWGINEFNGEYSMVISILTKGTPNTVGSTIDFKVQDSIFDYKLFDEIIYAEGGVLNKETMPNWVDEVHGGDGIFGFVGNGFKLTVEDDDEEEMTISFNYGDKEGKLREYIVTWKIDGSITVNNGELIAK